MSVLSPLSANDTAPLALDVFSVPANQVAVQRYFFEDVRPISQFTGVETPLEFETNLQGDMYTDIANSKLFLKVRILKANGARLQPDEKVAPVNLFFHAMFKKVDLYYNRALVSSSGDLYPYKAYFNTIFNHDVDDKSGYLQAQAYYPDSYGFMSETDPNSGNSGLFERSLLIKGSKLLDMAGVVLNDCLQLDRFMINGVHLRLVLFRNSADFCLISGEEGAGGGYKLQIEDAFLRLCKLKINPAILVAHSKLLKSVTAKYPFTRTEIKCASIPSGQNAFNWDNINSSYLPRFVLITFVESAAVLGSLKFNPFNFANFDVKQVNLCLNGVSCPGAPVNVNYDQAGQSVMEVFDRLYSKKTKNYSHIAGIGGRVGHSGLAIDRSDVAAGFGVYTFQLEPVLEDDLHFDLLKTGTLSLMVKFGQALQQNVSCLILTESYSMFEIEESRVVRIT